MNQKSKRGRKKKQNKLVRANFRVEEQTIKNLNEIARLLNEIKGKDSITFSDVARRLLDRRCALLLKVLQEQLNENVVDVDEIKNAAAEVSEEERQQSLDDFLDISTKG